MVARVARVARVAGVARVATSAEFQNFQNEGGIPKFSERAKASQIFIGRSTIREGKTFTRFRAQFR